PEGSQRKCKGKQRVGPSESVEELLASFQELQFPFACSSESAPDTKLNLPTGTDLEESEDDNEDESADDNEDESADQESLQWVTAQNFRNILPYLCQHLPKAMSKPLLDFVKPSKSVGQFSQAMNLNYNPKKLETLDLETHELLQRSALYQYLHFLDKKQNHHLIPRLVHQQKSITFGHTTYTLSDQHAGNSTILYYILDTKGARQDVHGQISQIFTMSYSTKKDTPRQIHLWFEVERYNDLSPADRKKHNFKDWPYVKARVVYNYVKARVVYNLKKKKDYIQMDHVIGHTATWQLPPACFGIGRKALFVVDLSKNVSNDTDM
ncbi:hypothetical protein PSHT_15407, partial [Puccinia striiformis]